MKQSECLIATCHLSNCSRNVIVHSALGLRNGFSFSGTLCPFCHSTLFSSLWKSGSHMAYGFWFNLTPSWQSLSRLGVVSNPSHSHCAYTPSLLGPSVGWTSLLIAYSVSGGAVAGAPDQKSTNFSSAVGEELTEHLPHEWLILTGPIPGCYFP